MTSILIVEDDDNLSAGLTALFTTEGFICMQAKDGNAGFACFKEKKPDICVLDVMLPGINGFELLKKIRIEGCSTPVVILSAKSNESDRIEGFDVGSDDYVTKPFSPPELVARVKAILKRTRGNFPNNQFSFGDLIIDPNSQRATRGKEVIGLKDRELKIVQILKNNQGCIVTRDMMMDLAWGRSYMPSSRALDQYVSELRKKIELDPSNPKLISTVWGKGYRYDSQ
ncbi:MAG: response regulator transcription factor [Pseudomonadota bacterium]